MYDQLKTFSVIWTLYCAAISVIVEWFKKSPRIDDYWIRWLPLLLALCTTAPLIEVTLRFTKIDLQWTWYEQIPLIIFMSLFAAGGSKVVYDFLRQLRPTLLSSVKRRIDTLGD